MGKLRLQAERDVLGVTRPVEKQRALLGLGNPTGFRCPQCKTTALTHAPLGIES